MPNAEFRTPKCDVPLRLRGATFRFAAGRNGREFFPDPSGWNAVCRPLSDGLILFVGIPGFVQGLPVSRWPFGFDVQPVSNRVRHRADRHHWVLSIWVGVVRTAASSSLPWLHCTHV